MNKREILSSVNNPKVKILKKILKKGDENYFLVEGHHLVEEATKNNLIKEIYEVESQNNYPDSIKITDKVLNVITTTKTPEGVIGLCKKKIKSANLSDKIVFLDNVQDPGNVGTIIRTSRSFGFNTIYTNINVYNPKILRATQGSLFEMDIRKYNNSIEEVIFLKSKGYKIIATTLDKDSIELKKVNQNHNKIVLLLGNEGQGLSKEVQNLSDIKVYIPIEFESLNVAVAAGICLYTLKNGEE
ncbi:RNA methyltransferase [Mycoplasma sp. Mirounga ES2805-ORL]|uniref:TrmH family RNA methyltransferase n=1 Tax=Mycoplasma sp. Mirounga ES2805-ORL TaxID=754514 RepID=UPI00197BCFCC|nr:RNA methyltransferase [Mycoplasma sp. Mirounga ES2805-ORL]QSF13491.1 RNA methyltransferase [Mycoplasma sp. Mirounga ES2805-ORL]